MPQVWPLMLQVVYREILEIVFYSNVSNRKRCIYLKGSFEALSKLRNIKPAGSNVTDDARADVSSLGFWSPLSRAFFDIRVVHPLAETN